MDHSFTFNDNAIKRVPLFLVLILILLLGLPYLAMHLGMDFSIPPTRLGDSPLVESQIRGYFRQILLQWSGFSLAAITALFAFIQYRLSADKIALIIGLSIAFSGSLEALHILVIDGIALPYSEKNNLDALLWIFSNSIGGLILLLGLAFLLYSQKKQNLHFSIFILLTSCSVIVAAALIYYAASLTELPNMWFKEGYLSRPYELITIGIYLVLIVAVYPKTFKAYPYILTNCIFYMAVTQIVISLYVMILSNTPYDSAYNIAYFLKIINYLIPCVCLLMNYIGTYFSVLNTQKRLRMKQRELQYLASHDPLTNLFNRREFENLLDKTLANANRNQIPLALLLIDLDNFKITNDTFGHVHGDELLKQFSNRLILITRKGDLLSRVGGDEFTLIAPNLHTSSSARQLAERILSELNSPYPISGKLITLTVSIGIAMFPYDGTNTEDLLKKADLAMYKAKNSGKNTYQFYTEELSYIQHRESEVETHLRKALQNDEFELYYQPKFNLINKEVIGAEVLLRWNNEVLGSVMPEEFIPVAENTGLIIDMGHWLIRKTCEQVMKWESTYHCMLPFSINISPIQLVHNQFLNTLEHTLYYYKYPPHYLELEITENLLMTHKKEVNHLLHKISSFGIKLSLDDFGKGYSSLNRLQTLPIDILKIDKEFTNDIHNDREKVIIIDIIIKLATELKMDIVAEGIETLPQLNYLISKKCYIGQGLLLSKPLSATEFAQLAFTNWSYKKNNVIRSIK